MESAPTAVREGLRPCGGVYGGAGGAGRCKHRPLHGFAMPQDCGFPVAAGPVRFAGNDLDRSAGPCAAATGPIGNRPLRRRGRFAAKRRRSRRGGVRGGMRASRPTDVLQVSHQPGMHPLLTRETPVGADSISARGVSGGAKWTDMESAPTAAQESLQPSGGVYSGAGVAAKAALLYPAQRNIRPQAEAAGVYFTGYFPHKEIYARRRKLRAYILRDIGRGARFSAARLCGRFSESPRRGGI